MHNTHKRRFNETQECMSKNDPSHTDHTNAINRRDCRRRNIGVEDLPSVTDHGKAEKEIIEKCCK